MMRATIRFATVAFVACCAASLASFAVEGPQVQIDGYRCRIVPHEDSPPGAPGLADLVCQIDDEPNPVFGVPSGGASPRFIPLAISSLFNRLTDRDLLRSRIRQLARDAIATPATP